MDLETLTQNGFNLRFRFLLEFWLKEKKSEPFEILADKRLWRCPHIVPPVGGSIATGLLKISPDFLKPKKNR